MNTVLEKRFFVERFTARGKTSAWPGGWIGPSGIYNRQPQVAAYRLKFRIGKLSKIKVYVSADERYDIFLDGKRFGRGPERGDRENWFFETYNLKLSEGEHVIVARTWWLGEDGQSPHAQITLRPGFILAAEGRHEKVLNTGIAGWEYKKLTGYHWINPAWDWQTGAKMHIRGADFSWGFEEGSGNGWKKVKEICPGFIRKPTVGIWSGIWVLKPAVLPPMLESRVKGGKVRHVQPVDSEETRSLPVKAKEHLKKEETPWEKLFEGTAPLTVPPHTRRRVIVDLENYFCAYTEVILSGGKGAQVKLAWAEALYHDFFKDRYGYGKTPKGNRDEIEGKFFFGFGNIFEPDGRENRRFETLWWEAGRYLEIFVSTGDQPLTINSVGITETRYPYRFKGRFECGDSRFTELTPIILRTLEMCSHETYLDCPYYEQLMYIGDTRLDVLTAYCLTRDDRLAKKALLMFDKSRDISGITRCSYPTRVDQVIPPFSLWWIAMVHDYAMWRNDPAFVGGLMPGVRAVLEAYRRWVNREELVESPEGWNFVDWVPGWRNGMPSGADSGINATLNWQFALVLRQAAELEELAGEPELAVRNRKLAARVAAAAAKMFWDENRGLFAEDRAKKHFGEHAQCLAILSGFVSGEVKKRLVKGLMEDNALDRTTIYFTHYLFEAYRRINRMDRFFKRMDLWFKLKGQGFRTTPEKPEPSRSDCHGWSTHPLFHSFASVLGIRPAEPGFASVRMEPQLGPLKWVRGVMPHPAGFISADLKTEGGRLAGAVELPDRIRGTLVYNNRTIRLKPGMQKIQM
ncbi:MAG: alpha-L-rhamnosidase C-terminal domain-containing protein [Candidatus Omnitrophota bacterium]